jgi:hypothetical protein
MPFTLLTGASAGIGLELGRVFARHHHDLILVARRKEKLDDLAALWSKEFGVKAEAVVMDLADPAAPEKLHDATKGREVDILVNNAGFGVNGPFEKTDLRRELDMIQLNVTALTHLTKLYLRDFAARGAGRILNVASTAAFQPGPLMAVYYATKAYVLSFSEALAEELRGTKITVTALCPGPTATEFQKVAAMEKSPLVRTFAMPAAPVAEKAYRALMKGKRILVPGITNKLGVAALRVSPRGLVTRIVKGVNRAD